MMKPAICAVMQATCAWCRVDVKVISSGPLAAVLSTAARELALKPSCVGGAPARYQADAAALHDPMEMAELPTAMLCGSDIFAIGFVLVAKTTGLRTPDDPSITDFDTQAFLDMLDPSPTTIDLAVWERSRCRPLSSRHHRRRGSGYLQGLAPRADRPGERWTTGVTCRHPFRSAGLHHLPCGPDLVARPFIPVRPSVRGRQSRDRRQHLHARYGGHRSHVRRQDRQSVPDIDVLSARHLAPQGVNRAGLPGGPGASPEEADGTRRQIERLLPGGSRASRH